MFLKRGLNTRKLLVLGTDTSHKKARRDRLSSIFLSKSSAAHRIVRTDELTNNLSRESQRGRSACEKRRASYEPLSALEH